MNETKEIKIISDLFKRTSLNILSYIGLCKYSNGGRLQGIAITVWPVSNGSKRTWHWCDQDLECVKINMAQLNNKVPGTIIKLSTVYLKLLKYMELKYNKVAYTLKVNSSMYHNIKRCHLR